MRGCGSFVLFLAVAIGGLGKSLAAERIRNIKSRLDSWDERSTLQLRVLWI